MVFMGHIFLRLKIIKMFKNKNVLKNRYFKIKIFVFTIFLFINSLCFGASQQTSSTTASTMIDRVEALLNDSDNRMWSAGDLLTWLNEGMVDIVTRSHCLETLETIFLDTNTIEYSISSTYTTVKAVQYVDGSHTIYSLKKGSPAGVGQNTAATIPTYWYDWGGKIGIYPALTSLENSSSTVAISGAANDGTGEIRITTSAAHGFSTGDHVTIASVVGTTEANGDWTITVQSTTTFDLDDSTYTNAYTSGGTVFETEAVHVYLITRPTSIASTANITTPAIYDGALVMYIMAQAYLRDNQLNRYLQTFALYEAEMARIRNDLNEIPMGPTE